MSNGLTNQEEPSLKEIGRWLGEGGSVMPADEDDDEERVEIDIEQ